MYSNLDSIDAGAAQKATKKRRKKHIDCHQSDARFTCVVLEAVFFSCRWHYEFRTDVYLHHWFDARISVYAFVCVAFNSLQYSQHGIARVNEYINTVDKIQC